MKLEKSLAVADVLYNIISDDIRLQLNTPGRASFTVQADEELSGIVICQAGWSGQSARNIFYGFVERSIKINSRQQLLYCREQSARADKKMDIVLRNATIPQILEKVTQKTGLTFFTPDAEYMQAQMPYFYANCGGYKVLDDIGVVFNISNYIWQQMADGRIYLGSWDDSHWPVNTLILPDSLLADYSVDSSAWIGLIPAIRPGALTNRGMVAATNIMADKMDIEWKH